MTLHPEQKQTDALKKAMQALRNMKARLDALERAKHEPIAVLGFGCRFPGGNRDGESLWDFLSRNGDGIGEVPPQRWPWADYFDPRVGQPGKMYTRMGGFLDDIEGFDAAFFGISPKEARSMDPQQRLMLEVAWEALEHAGIAADKLEGSRTGVFVGQVVNDFADLQFKSADVTAIDPFSGTGCYASSLSGRISYFLGLQGPAVSLDTACSTSLVAIHQAVQSLRLGESDLALAGGVNLILSPNHFIYYCALNALAADGRCKAFDMDADGFVKAEGCGLVVLKRLTDALRDGDPILAVVRGSAVNHDGRTSGFTVPNGLAQERVLRMALADARAEPDEVAYVEAHGTGTSLGDPIEAGALLNVLRGGGTHTRPLVLGSVKTNFGHAESAAGIAGFIKAVLALKHGRIPGQRNFKNLNPAIDPGLTPLLIPGASCAWPDGERLAGVSSLGISGTNAHIILGPAPERDETSSTPALPGHLLPLSAKSGAALDALADHWIAYLEGENRDLAAVCRGAAHGRAHLTLRLAVSGATGAEMAAHLRNHRRGRPSPSLACGRRVADKEYKIAFIYPGQGSQWLGMGRMLMATHEGFRSTIASCDSLSRELEGWSILDELNAAPEDSHLDETRVAQPAIFAVQVALSLLWRSLGIEPDAVVGHSMGEVAAAHVAGALSLRDAMRIICARSRLVGRVAGKGAMALIEMSRDDAAVAVAPFVGRLDIAAANGPRATVVSGDPEALDLLLTALEARDIFCRRIKVDYASHCHLMDDIMDDLRRELAPTEPRPSELRFCSTVLGETVPGGDLDGAYWARNLRRPVLFYDQIQKLLGEGFNVFIEISPHPVLTYSIKEGMPADEEACLVLGTLSRDENEWLALMRSIGMLYAGGYPFDWPLLYPQRDPAPDLPHYPWQRARYWPEPQPTRVPIRQSAAKLVRFGTMTEGDRLLVEELTARHGFASRTVGQATGKQFLFINEDRDALFFFNQRGKSLVAINYTGPDRSFMATAAALNDFAKNWGLDVSILEETDRHVDQLVASGWTTTPVGVWQSITPIAGFDLAGGKMRRLRYAVSRYENQEGVTRHRHRFGEDEATDQACFALMRAWAATKPGADPLIAHIQSQIEQGLLQAGGRRTYLVKRRDLVDGIIIISPCVAMNGYLMDMEFYGPDVPMGCMEYGIVGIIEDLVAEGSETLSLGLTLGIRHPAHPGQDDSVAEFFAHLYEAGILNGEANCRFKDKFRPSNQTSFLCRPAGGETEHLHDFLQMLGDPMNATAREALHFFGEVPNQVGPAADPVRAVAHPLVHRRLDLAGCDWFFESELDLRHLAYLADHRLQAEVVFPLTALIEAALYAGIQVHGASALETFIIRQPLRLKPAAPVKLQFLVKPGHPGRMHWSLCARGGDQTDWTTYAQGDLVQTKKDHTPPARDLESLRPAHLRQVQGKELYPLLEAAGYGYGPAFRGLDSLWLDADRAVGLVRANASSQPGYHYHPAVLDACFQVCLPLLSQLAGDRFYLPVAMDRFEAFESLREEIYAVATLTDRGSEGIASLDLDIIGLDGCVLARVAGLAFREITREQLRLMFSPELSRFYFRMQWELCDHPLTAAEPFQGDYLLLRDEDSFGEALAGALMDKGFKVHQVRRGHEYSPATEGIGVVDPARRGDFALLLAALEVPALRIIHAWRMPQDDGPEALQVSLEGLLNLIHALCDAQLEQRCQVWLTTRGAIAHENRSISPANAAIWGFGRVLAREMPELWGGLVDVAAATPSQTAAILLRESAAPAPERFLAYRGNQRFVARLNACPPPAAEQADFRDGTYLITGGHGALGLALAEWLVEQGARHLVLASRQSPGEPACTRLQAMSARGVVILSKQVDVTDAAALEALFAELSVQTPPLRGIFHLAGLVDDGLILQQTPARFERVLAPKVTGSMNLHRCSLDLDLRHFVLFSSAAAWLGTSGQSSYAAANAWMDALAQERRRLGLAGLSINWGVWGEEGIAAALSEREKQQLHASGLEPFGTDQGLAAMARVLEARMANIGICPLDLQRLGGSALADQSLIRNLVGANLVPEPDAAHVHLDLETLRNADEEERSELLLAYFCDQIALVLGMDPASLDREEHFTNLGLNSLMIMELRNKLKAETGLSLSAVMFFRHPSVARLAATVLAQFDETQASPEPVAPETAAEINLDDMSDTQVDDMLLQLLAEQDDVEGL